SSHRSRGIRTAPVCGGHRIARRGCLHRRGPGPLRCLRAGSRGPELFSEPPLQAVPFEVALRQRCPDHPAHEPDAEREKDDARQTEVEQQVQAHSPIRRDPIWVQRGGLPVDAAPRSSAVSGWCALTYATRMSRTAMPPYRFGAPSSMVSPSPPLVRKSVTATVYVPGAQEASHASPLQLRVSQRTLPASSTIRTTIAPSGGIAFPPAPNLSQSIT